MQFIIFVIWVLAAIWGVLWAARGSVVLGSAAYLMVSSIFGPEFFSFELSGMTISLDRLILPAIFAAYFAQRFVFGRRLDWTLTQIDVVLLTFVALLMASTFWHDWQREAEEQIPIFPHLVEGYLFPIFLFWMLKRSDINQRVVRWLFGAFAVLGLYLSFTAVCEVTGTWDYVFPRYIADPELGIHFGRARGPFLQSVRMGMYLLTGLGAIWISLVHREIWGRPGRILGLGLSLFVSLAVVLTMTRSIWLGLAVATLMLMWCTLQGMQRRAAVVSLLGALILAFVLNSQSIITMEREHGSQATAESTSMRAVFAYVSWMMFKDQPITGCGFGHFPHLKDAYLSDRSTTLQLETVRGFIHHNTYLSLLVELGIFGLMSMVALLVLLQRKAVRLWRDLKAASWMRDVALLFILFSGAFMIQMLFHEVSYSPVEFGLFFFLAGTMSAVARKREQEIKASPSYQVHMMCDPCLPHDPVVAGALASARESGRIQLFGVKIDAMTMADAMARILSWTTEEKTACRYVVTPNVDHTVMLQERTDLRQVYQDADVVLADGWPVVAAARLLGKPLPNRVAGSDLVPSLFAGCRQGQLNVFLLGAMAGVAERAAKNIERQWPHVKVVGTYSPPLGFEHDAKENNHILELIARACPDILVVGLGAPKQELWVHKHRTQIRAKVALCVGATIDFLAGHKTRAPRWVQVCGMEWCHRMLSEPRRLLRRYARDAWVFPQLVWQEWYKTTKRA